MRYLTTELGRLGYRWAYRVVDARAFGLPQRRQRVILLASMTEDPRPVLLDEDAGAAELPLRKNSVCGFYWTEGLRGLGWAVDAVPTLKGGSGIGIPSPPAMWWRRMKIPLRTPDIRDAERLQGFEADWTAAAHEAGSRGLRWKLVGNAVSVPVAEWVGERLAYDRGAWSDHDLGHDAVERRWPTAAWGESDRAYAVEVSAWPRRLRYQRLGEFLQHETVPLSHRATRGFYERTRRSGLNFVAGSSRLWRLTWPPSRRNLDGGASMTRNPQAISSSVSARMAGTGRRDTQPELRLRSELHRRGLQYRVDYAPLREVRRRADVVFTRRCVAVFVDGCYWHGCPEHGDIARSTTRTGGARSSRQIARAIVTPTAVSPPPAGT